MRFLHGAIALGTMVFCTIFSPAAKANSAADSNPEKMQARAHDALANLLEDNEGFAKKHTKQCFEPFLGAQSPRITLVMCSDSRIHTYAFDETPDNDLFVIRNIGNQVTVAEGSVEYGVRHLNTPIVFILGHTGCGAVKATLGDYSTLEPSIKKELEMLKLSKKNLTTVDEASWLQGVRENVNHQVDFALRKFKKEVNGGKLAVVGGIYDLHNVYGKGNGRIVIINIDGITEPQDIVRHPLTKKLSVIAK